MARRRSGARVVVLAVLLALHRAGAQTTCEDGSPRMRMRMDCGTVREAGLCAKSGDSCQWSCGKCLNEQEEKNLANVQKSLFHCNKQTKEALSKEALTAFVLGVRSSGWDRNNSTTADASLQVASSDFLKLLEDPLVHEALTAFDLNCASRTLGFEGLLDVLFDNRTVAVPDGFHSLASPKTVRQFIVNFFNGRCSTEQLVGFLPEMAKLMRELVDRDKKYADDKEFLFNLYQSDYVYKGERVAYTQSTPDGRPALSLCFAKSLKSILSVRECDGRNCYRGVKRVDPLPPARYVTWNVPSAQG